MKEQRVSRLHLDMDPGVDVDPLGGEETENHFIPVRIAVFEQLSEMAPRNDGEASVLTGTWLDGRQVATIPFVGRKAK
jgi:hypothetical protein